MLILGSLKWVHIMSRRYPYTSPSSSWLDTRMIRDGCRRKLHTETSQSAPAKKLTKVTAIEMVPRQKQRTLNVLFSKMLPLTVSRFAVWLIFAKIHRSSPAKPDRSDRSEKRSYQKRSSKTKQTAIHVSKNP